MRVLWLTHFIPWPATGHGALQRTHQLLMRTASKHEVGLVALDPAGTAGACTARQAAAHLAPALAFCDVHPLGGARIVLRKVAAMAGAAIGARSYWGRGFSEPRARAAFQERL